MDTRFETMTAFDWLASATNHFHQIIAGGFHMFGLGTNELIVIALIGIVPVIFAIWLIRNFVMKKAS